MKREPKLFQTTGVLYADGDFQAMGGPLWAVREEASKYPGARAITVREVPIASRRKAKP